MHIYFGLSTLPMIMASELGTVVKKVATVKIKELTIGVFYIDDLDHVFTLESKVYNSDTRAIRKLNHLRNVPSSYLKFITMVPISYNEDDLHVEITDINESLINTIEPLKQRYDDINPNTDFKSDISSFDELKKYLNSTIADLIEKNPWSKPLRPIDPFNSNVIALQLLSHYMFEFNDQKFFMTNTNSDWYNKLLLNKKVISKYILTSELDALKTATSEISNKTFIENSPTDTIAASLILNHWERLFKSSVFQAEDGSFKFISADVEDISILPAHQTIKLTDQRSTGKLILTNHNLKS